MFEIWTDRARRSLVLAQEQARLLGHDHIGTGHMLLGLLLEGESTAYRALAALGVTAEAACEQLEKIKPRGTAPAGHIPFTAPAKRACERALRVSLIADVRYIGPEHVLMALLRDVDGEPERILSALGVSAEDVHAKVTELLAGYEKTEAARWEPRLAAHAAGAAPFKFARTDAGEDLALVGWQRSSFHKPTPLGDCVVVHHYGDGVIGVQDARVCGTSLAKLFSLESWRAFVAGVKNGEFDFGEVPADGS